jgi:hypothetical protein
MKASTRYLQVSGKPSKCRGYLRLILMRLPLSREEASMVYATKDDIISA